MGWIANTYDAIKSATAHEPIECPRGWGQVSFVASAWVVPPLFGVDRRCPIGGVADCGKCAYASNPDSFRLAGQLGELDRLRAAGQITAAECATRRESVLHLHQGSDSARRGLHAAAWIMGPLGALTLAAGAYLAAWHHPGFWGLAGFGCVLLVLALSFWGLARSEGPRKKLEQHD